MLIDVVRRHYPYVYFLLLALLLQASSARAKESIRWASLDFPPFDIHQGPLKNQGIINKIEAIIQANMVEYEHTHSELLNVQKLTARFEKNNICYAALLRRPSVEAVSYMSVGVGIMPAHGLITTENSTVKAFTAQTDISLQDLLGNQNVVFGFQGGTYGPLLNDLIEQHIKQKNIVIRQSNTINGLLKMLHRRRIDYTIGYPAEFIYWQAQYPDYQLKFIPLQETQGQYAIGRVACSKNAWGKRLIKQINQLLVKIRMQPDYINELYLPWVPKSIQATYLQSYQKIIGEEDWTNVEP